MSMLDNDVLPRHVTTGCQYLIVVEESAAAEISCVSWQFSGDAHSSVTVLQTDQNVSKVMNTRMTLTCRLSRCCPVLRTLRSFLREHRRMSSPTRIGVGWREPCSWSSCPRQSACHPERLRPGSWSQLPSAWRTPATTREIRFQTQENNCLTFDR